MKNELILDAVGLIDQVFINEFTKMDIELTEGGRILPHDDVRKRRRAIAPALVAACLCLATAVTVMTVRHIGGFADGSRPIGSLPISPLASGSASGSDTPAVTPNVEIPTLKMELTDGGEAYAVSSGKGLSGGVQIPSSYNGKPIVEISARAFADCTGLTDITIPETVEVIGDGAFWGCTGLTRIVLPNGIRQIGDEAFFGCRGVTMVILPDTLDSVGRSAFDGLDPSCYKQTGYGKYLSTEAEDHYLLVSITRLDPAEGCEVVAQGAFEGYSGTELFIPKSIRSIPDGAFSRLANLIEVTFESGSRIKSLGREAFALCTNLRTVVLPEGITEIPERSFLGCLMLRDVALPEGIVTLSDGAFEGCLMLFEIGLPATVKVIGDGAFAGIDDLRTLRFLGTKSDWDMIEKGEGWKHESARVSVICADGTVVYD